MKKAIGWVGGRRGGNHCQSGWRFDVLSLLLSRAPIDSVRVRVEPVTVRDEHTAEEMAQALLNQPTRHALPGRSARRKHAPFHSSKNHFLLRPGRRIASKLLTLRTYPIRSHTNNLGG